MDKSEKIAYASVLSFLSLFILLLTIFLFLLCRKKKPIRFDEPLISETKPAGVVYSLTEIDLATDGFNQRRIIGKGRLGTVYAAVIPRHRNLVTVKRIHPGLVLSKPGFGFSTVIKKLSSSLHSNVVSILGFSEAPGERIVVTEFIGDGKSLSDYLHDDSEIDSAVAVEFGWKKRFKIAAGAARGLEYLHEIANPRIVHGRFTASNILIDLKFSAKICDYGFGFLIPREKSELFGCNEEGYCKESDVYGYGVVLLEILSGRRSENGLIVKWATPLIKEQRFGELLDPRIVVQSETKSLVIRLAKVALACVGNSRRNRPSISEVAAILNSLERESGLI